jgi:Domain of Unknown Function (DUF1080)
MRTLALSLLAALATTSCATGGAAPEGSAPTWRQLFDGARTKGWRGFKTPAFPETGWAVVDGTLRSERGQDGRDIVTDQQYGDFELVLEFRLNPGGNSGIKYLVDESLVKQGRHGLGFEYQIIDDQAHPDAAQGKPGTRTCGALYDLIAPSTDRKVHAPGQWNEARLVVDGARIEHWLNGVKLLEFRRASPELQALIADSKYKSIPAFGQPARGHILIQAHGDEVAFRNIRVRELRPAEPARVAHTP